MGNVPPAPIVGTPLTLGSLISGTIATTLQQDRYTFSLASDARLSFDSRTNSSGVGWSLNGPTGMTVTSRQFSQSDGISVFAVNAVLDLVAGDYVLTVAGQSGGTAPTSSAYWTWHPPRR